MHDSVKNALKDWIVQNQEFVDSAKVAELGCQNVNGNILDCIPTRTGFDLIEDISVDVTIKLGEIPEEHRHQYDLVISLSSFQFCNDLESYIKEIQDLLKPNGKLFLTMCGTGCIHMDDYIRFTKREAALFFNKHFRLIKIKQLDSAHQDLIVVAEVRP